MVHVAIFTSEMIVYPSCQAQIASLKAKDTFVTVPAKYLDFANVFFEKLATMLLEHIEINNYSINLEVGKQPLYEPIYSLGSVELETLKIYIEINLDNSFIRPSKFHTSILILFD